VMAVAVGAARGQGVAQGSRCPLGRTTARSTPAPPAPSPTPRSPGTTSPCCRAGQSLWTSPANGPCGEWRARACGGGACARLPKVIANRLHGHGRGGPTARARSPRKASSLPMSMERSWCMACRRRFVSSGCRRHPFMPPLPVRVCMAQAQLPYPWRHVAAPYGLQPTRGPGRVDAHVVRMGWSSRACCGSHPGPAMGPRQCKTCGASTLHVPAHPLLPPFCQGPRHTPALLLQFCHPAVPVAHALRVSRGARTL
jgi:hypothetical protein